MSTECDVVSVGVRALLNDWDGGGVDIIVVESYIF